MALAAPSILTIYGGKPRFRDALVLGISQSGASPDIIAVLAEARRQGALTAVITNDVRSDLAAQGDVVIDLGAGEERAVAATKTYTAELAAIALLSATLSDQDDAHTRLQQMPDAVHSALATAGAHPVCQGHTLVVRKLHFESAADMNDELLGKIIVAAKRIGNMQKEKLQADGFNIPTACGRAAQQSVFHAHFHVVPRFTGDGLNLWFHGRQNDMSSLEAVFSRLTTV